jgi:hypothetical protein
MMQIDWIVDSSEWDEQRLDRPSAESVSRYFRGFNFNKPKRRPMFEDELRDLEIVYRKTLDDLDEQVQICLPSLLVFMEQFLKLHKQNEAIREKLDVLLAKSRREDESEEQGFDYGCANEN